jgi:hypothetical protein
LLDLLQVRVSGVEFLPRIKWDIVQRMFRADF